MQDETLQTAGEEISLKDIVHFFKRNWKRIVFCGVAGLLLSSAYVIVAPREYGAIWQMKMAQINNNINSNNNNSNSNGLGNIEEPAALIERLRFSTAYPGEVQQQCGMRNDEEVGAYLNKKLEVQAIKNLTELAQFKYLADSPAQAKQCAEAIVTMIMVQQRSLIEESLAGRQAQLNNYQAALTEEQRKLEKKEKSELVIFNYLAKRDRLSWLRSRIDALQEEALLSQMHPSKLIAPISVSSKPISPKVGLGLLLGISLGLMLGVLYALGREVWRKTV